MYAYAHYVNQPNLNQALFVIMYLSGCCIQSVAERSSKRGSSDQVLITNHPGFFN